MGLDVYGLSGIFKDEEKDLLYERTWYLGPSVFPQNEGFEDGSYRARDVTHYRVGSYSTYNLFRESLCKALTGKKYEFVFDEIDKDLRLLHSIPMAYLLFFSDCDGYIGTKYCKKLVDEFEKYEPLLENNGSFRQSDGFRDFFLTFRELKTCFEFGSDDGVVVFY